MATKKSVKKSLTKEAKEMTAKKSSVVAKKAAGRSATTSTEKATEKVVKKTTKTVVKKAVKKAASSTAKKTLKATEREALKPVKKVSPAKKADVVKAQRSVLEAEYRKPSADPEIRKLVQALVAFLDEKKLTDIKVMNLEDVNPYFSFFMIATAGSALQLGTTAREISRRFGEHLTNKKIRPLDVESGWVIHDFVDVVLHVFLQEQRNYYNLEKLWGDAPVIYSAEAPRFQWPR